SHLERVVVLDSSRRAHDLGERPEGDAFAVRETAPVNGPRRIVGAREELAQESRLADARGAEHGDELSAGPGRRALEGVEEDPELLGSADHRGVEPARDTLLRAAHA